MTTLAKTHGCIHFVMNIFEYNYNVKQLGGTNKTFYRDDSMCNKRVKINMICCLLEFCYIMNSTSISNQEDCFYPRTAIYRSI